MKFNDRMNDLCYKPSLFGVTSSEDIYWYSVGYSFVERNYGKVKHLRLSTRRKLSRKFRQRTYNRRVMIEAGFSAIKRKYGSCVNSKTASTIRAEVYGKLICHNLFSYLFRVLGQSLL